MSVESAKAFIERMKTDEDFAKQVIDCSDNESRMKFVTAAGFDFTHEEIQNERLVLSDEGLDQISGGFPSAPCILLPYRPPLFG